MTVRVLTWNLFHGRDAPPDPCLHTWRSRILGAEERNATHAQVNRPLRTEFSDLIAGLEWDLALIQEAPPRWLEALCSAARASGRSALTARNLGAGVRAPLAEWRPDLLASWEGGSNLLLARAPWRIDETRRLTLTHRPERRRMLWVRLSEPGGRTLCAANLHASITGRGPERDVVRAAARALAWAGASPLVLGGDLNLRPRLSPAAFEALARRGLGPAGAPDSVDHLLAHGLEVVEPPRALPAARREIERPDGRRLRLSDHAPLLARFALGGGRGLRS